MRADKLNRNLSVLLEVEREPGRSSTEVARTLGIRRMQARGALQRLKREGLVRWEPEARNGTWYPEMS